MQLLPIPLMIQALYADSFKCCCLKLKLMSGFFLLKADLLAESTNFLKELALEPDADLGLFYKRF